jgi:glycosyltransferase involved in cell wall biosynthesis
MPMRPARRFDLAERIRVHRTRLEQTLAEIAERGTPLTETEARLIVEVAELQLAEVERELRRWRASDWMPARLRRLLRRIRGLSQPRIGRLQHYPARPLRVPASYHAVKPPQAAPTISIVTPSYQHAKFLERTVQSVVGQSYPALEYVVQDGGSTDGTLEILERVGPHLTRWTSEPDGGHADALNRGFRLTTGEIMGWLNSDDLLLPGSLAYVADYFVAHPDVDVVYGNRLLIDAQDCEIGAWILPAHDDAVLTLADFVPQETLFWRRRIWDAAGGGLDETFGYALDWDLLLRFRDANARMVRLPRFLGAFRVHDEQRTSAAHVVGLEEMARLRERAHGRPVSNAEVNERLRPYLRRHVYAHLRHRVVDRLPIHRVPVEIPSTNALRSREIALKA